MESTSSQTSSFFSSIITLYILIFLYFPCNYSLKLIVSPILVSTLILLLSLLRLGTSQQTLLLQQQSHEHTVEPEPELESESKPEPEFNKISLTLAIQTSIEPKPKPEPEQKLGPSLKSDLSQKEEAKTQPIKTHGLEPETKQIINTDTTNKVDMKSQPDPVSDPFPYYTETFVGWAVCAPLEVIYESYEGEEDVDMYVESGSDTDTDTGSSSSSWEEEEKEGMFEISLDYGYGDYNNKSVVDMKKLKNEFEVDEEDNLIEIDISF